VLQLSVSNSAVAVEPHPTIQKRVNETKLHVCQVAARLFNESSFAAVTIETIVLEAGIARSTFYRWFDDKEDLLRKIIVPVFEDAQALLITVDAEQPEEIVNGIADSYITIWEQHRDALQLTSNLDAALYPLVAEAHNRYAEAILALMSVVNESRLLRNDDTRLSAVILAQTFPRLLKVCETHPQFPNVFKSTVRGMLLKW